MKLPCVDLGFPLLSAVYSGHGLKWCGKERVYSLYNIKVLFPLQFQNTAYLSSVVVKEGNLAGWQLEDVGWCRGQRDMLLTGLLFLSYSACLFIASKTTCTEVALPTVSYSLPHQSSLQSRHHLHTVRLWGCFYQLSFCLLKWPIVCSSR